MESAVIIMVCEIQARSGIIPTSREHFFVCVGYRIEFVQYFFDQVGHETMYASSGNKHFFTKSCHRQTYQNYEQSRQKLGTILENKVS